MIIKGFEINKINLDDYKLYLFYGKNEGLKNELIHKYFTKDLKGSIIKYDEKEFLNNQEIILGQMMNRSLFENEKLIIISRVSDKTTNVINEILDKDIGDIKIILKSGILEKRSKLRVLFEKNKSLISIPFYEENSSSLASLVINFLNKNKIKVSREAINLLVNRARGDRDNITNELRKIKNYSTTNKNITFENIQKLTNLAENYEVGELVDGYLSKNTKKVSKILNENNYSYEDCVLILRTILAKSKRLLSILEQYNENKNLDEIIANTKPPIFWKEIESIKIQVNSWKLKDLKSKMYALSEIEILVKSNSQNSINLVSDYIINY